MGTQFLNVDVGRCMINLTNKPNSTMFRFVALFSLVAVALAEPEADAQFLVNPINTVVGAPVVNTYADHVVNPVNTYTVPRIVSPVVYNKVVPVVKQVVKPIQYHVPVVKPVVKYVDAHHTEGMTAEGVPQKTDSVKIAEKQHELAKTIEESRAKVAYVAPYTTYGGVTYPYVHNVAHVVAKREADSEAEPEPYVTYNGVYGTVYGGVNPLVNTYTTPYTTAVAGFPYTTTTLSGYHYKQPYVAPVVYRGKRDADSQYYSPYAYNTYNYAPYRYNYAPYAYTNGYYY